VVAVTALSALFLSRSPPLWIRGAGAGAGAAVAAVAVRAGLDLLLPSWRRSVERPAYRPRWLAFAGAGAAAGALLGPYLVLVLFGCGLIEVSAGTRSQADVRKLAGILPFPVAATAGGLGPLAWVAFKVGALSYGGGFVIVPLMQRDAVHTYHWLSATQFLGAVSLGQVTPGPVVATVAAVGYAAHRLAGAALAAVIAFLPSFLIVLAGAPHFARVRQNRRMLSFLDGAGPAATGAILGSAVPLAGALRESWQAVLLGAAAAMLLVLRRGVVPVLLVAGAVGAGIAAAGGPVP
jgi:chromate transporter